MAASPRIDGIFDRPLIRARRDRAAAHAADYDFLLRHAADSLLDRLRDIRRTFPLTLQIGARRDLAPDLAQIAGTQTLAVMDLAKNPLAAAPGLRFQGDEEFLPLRTNSIDMALSLLTLHTVNDLPGALIGINRALKPDGLFLGALFGGETLWELRRAMTLAEMEIMNGASPRIAPFADKPQMGALLQRAGFALPVVDSDIVTVTYENTYKLMRDLRGMGENGAAKARSRTVPPRAFFAATERIYREQFAEPDGRLRASFEIIFLIGWSPHSSQPRPLPRGSARNSLAEALETVKDKGQ